MEASSYRNVIVIVIEDNKSCYGQGKHKTFPDVVTFELLYIIF